MVLGSSINMQRSTSVERGGCYAGKPPMVPPTLETTMASTPAGSISASPHHNSHVHVIGFNQHDNIENNQRTSAESNSITSSHGESRFFQKVPKIFFEEAVVDLGCN